MKGEDELKMTKQQLLVKAMMMIKSGAGRRASCQKTYSDKELEDIGNGLQEGFLALGQSLMLQMPPESLLLDTFPTPSSRDSYIWQRIDVINRRFPDAKLVVSCFDTIDRN
jgi:hypothetical protein